jgi:hypothetical protein
LDKGTVKATIRCQSCDYNLTAKMVSIESVDEHLWNYSGMYCPSCFTDAVLARADDFEQLNLRRRSLTRESSCA